MSSIAIFDTDNIPLLNLRLIDKGRPPYLVFLLLWTLTFLLYLPAARAGFVVDFTGWLEEVKNTPFPDYINRTNFSVKSLYQFTQFVSWFFYQLFGTNAWMWHLLFVSLQAVNAFFLFKLTQGLGKITRIAKPGLIAGCAAILFCICPHISEVIVWEPSLHYLLALLLILLILNRAMKFMETGQLRPVWWALALYLLSVFSLEYFYLTPFLVLSLAIYYRRVSGEKEGLKRGFLYFFLPLLAIMILRTLLFKFLYDDWVSRTGESALEGKLFDYLVKPVKYVFHILLFGRFWDEGLRKKVYELCSSPMVVYSFYVLLLMTGLLYLRYFRLIGNRVKLMGLFLLWTTMAALLVSPMWFPEMMLLQFDRYAYMIVALAYVSLAAAIFSLPRRPALVTLAVYSLFCIGFTLKLNRFWHLSAKINRNLLHTFPDPGKKTVILLNLPESMCGVPMIQACTHGEFKLMHNLLMQRQINTTVYDISSFNMNSYWDAANVIVVNDSLVKVTLNQWGTWWWRDGQGAGSHETDDYRLDMRDAGHWYELSLKKPAANYMLLYLADGKWKQVDLALKGEEQF
jgi:hypothetical protein